MHQKSIKYACIDLQLTLFHWPILIILDVTGVKLSTDGNNVGYQFPCSVYQMH